eukprot:2363944-Pleurochrysis_carterae.AAC.1
MRVGDVRPAFRNALKEAMNLRTCPDASCLCFNRCTALNRVWSSTRMSAYLRAPSIDSTKGPAMSM